MTFCELLPFSLVDTVMSFFSFICFNIRSIPFVRYTSPLPLSEVHLNLITACAEMERYGWYEVRVRAYAKVLCNQALQICHWVIKHHLGQDSFIRYLENCLF
jgi:hypothetical protein